MLGADDPVGAGFLPDDATKSQSTLFNFIQYKLTLHLERAKDP